MFHLEGDVYEPRVGTFFLPAASQCCTSFYLLSKHILFHMQIAMHEKAASARWYTEITFWKVCWKHSGIFLLNLLAYFQCKTGSYCIMPPACSTGASKKMMCSVRLRKHSCKHRRALLGWAQQLWGGVMVKCAISSKIWDEDVFLATGRALS